MVYLLEMVLKDGIVALYPYHNHLLGFYKTHNYNNVCTVSTMRSGSNFKFTLHLLYRL